ncbi:MAG: hypothetical protein FD149_2010 [Rhodospirillaceae bacterium]|nr:MAG: hypothetical protein FD149_2010 [Rhodospirillaceae bacterium]
MKIQKRFDAPSDSYFLEETVSFNEKSKFGEGYCRIEHVHKKEIEVTLPNGKKIRIKVPIAYDVLAVADCTNNPLKLGSRIGTECEFTAKTERMN